MEKAAALLLTTQAGPIRTQDVVQELRDKSWPCPSSSNALRMLLKRWRKARGILAACRTARRVTYSDDFGALAAALENDVVAQMRDVICWAPPCTADASGPFPTGPSAW